MARLDGCAALVTGASSGIGAETALALAAEGASLALVGRNTARLAEVAQRIEGAGGRALVLAADITEATAPEQVVADAVAAFGRLDIVVNAAGVMLNGSSLKRPFEEWRQMVDLNLTALMAVSKAALPHLVAAAQSGRGVSDLVNISSIAGRTASAGAAVYHATKFGVTAFSESLRQEFARRNLRVSVIEPGAVRTGLFDHGDPVARGRLAERLAEVEYLHPEDIADLVTHVVTLPRRVALAEVVIRPTDHV